MIFGAGGYLGRPWRDTSRRRRLKFGWNGAAMSWLLLLLLLLTFLSPARAVWHSFDNCMDENTQRSDPLQLQFIPSNVSVVFDSLDPLHPLNITVYGNVSGLADTSASYPSPNDPGWADPNVTVGKIADVSPSNNKFSTLVTEIDVLNFSPYSHPSRFCESVV